MMKTWMTPPLPYGDEIINAEIDEINEDYNDVLYNYIGTEVVVTDMASCPPPRRI